MTIRVLDILEQTMADGPGLRTSIYCAGCAHHCEGCHNPQSWDFKGGKEMEVDDLVDLVLSDELSNVTFSGGDPLYQVEAFTELARKIKERSHKTIWCYTGFTYEEVLADKRLSQILPYIDTLVEGPFVLSLRDTNLLFRGSSNQRIIHLTPQEEDVIPGTVKLVEIK
ncbi:MAG: anaerobic ribonucleoside-triphosphate reductase activating protein [Bacteroidales bacterium]|nr:anaerobic ribonucleoside-triphosphate reductase activating protein [Bacteroidales bacterium]